MIIYIIIIDIKSLFYKFYLLLIYRLLNFKTEWFVIRFIVIYYSNQFDPDCVWGFGQRLSHASLNTSIRSINCVQLIYQL